MMQKFNLIFTANDTWFFKESRNMDDSGAILLQSMFPPPMKTLLGAIRTHIGDNFNRKQQLSWQDFNQDSELATIIGYLDNLGPLSAEGVWPAKLVGEKYQVYYPTPLNIVHYTETNELCFFNIGKPLRCDLGYIRLAKLEQPGAKPLENSYLSSSDFALLLNGEKPSYGAVQHLHKDILSTETRFGIARNNQSRAVVEGKLYQTEHLRLRDEWALSITLSGVNQDYLDSNASLRFGGEGRIAVLQSQDALPLPDKPTANHKTQGIILYLISDLLDERTDAKQIVLPNLGFKWIADKQSGDYALGEILGQQVKIVSALISKSRRIGGWDLKKHASTAVKSFIPAGSCWYIKTDTDNVQQAQQLIDHLHGQFLSEGSNKAYGYGQVLTGLWQE